MKHRDQLSRDRMARIARITRRASAANPMLVNTIQRLAQIPETDPHNTCPRTRGYIKKLRMRGHCICSASSINGKSCSTRPGYWYAETYDQAEACARSIEARCAETLRTARAVRRSGRRLRRET